MNSSTRVRVGPKRPLGAVPALAEDSDLTTCVARTGEVLTATFQTWDSTTRALDLLEEAGELARAILVHEGHKEGKSEKVGEALCGVLVDVFALADCYHIPLSAEYSHFLATLAQRPSRP